MSSLAIVGTGIAGLGCAHFLHREHEVTLFEQNSYVGGHTHTVDATEPGTRRRLPIDTGFMVCNRVTYPHLMRLFDSLQVPLKPSPMSFSVRHAESGLEFCGTSLNRLFAQRRNLVRPRFWRLLAAIQRFNQDALRALADRTTSDLTLADYVEQGGYGQDFLDLYLIPMSSAVWSTPPEQMLHFPAATLLRFFHNHGFLGLSTQHPWLTVDGGARIYVERMSRPWADRILLGDPVVRLARTARGVAVGRRSGRVLAFDRVILACHADQALALLSDARPEERRLLGAFHYHANLATLHTDPSVMPRTRRAWSSWNYEIAGLGADGLISTATHYWMNSLQGVSDRENYFVTINRPQAIDPAKVLRTFQYDHPLFSHAAVRAQPELPALNAAAAGTTETYFAGSYFRYGFHEDGLASAQALAGQLLGRDPWPGPADNSPSPPRELSAQFA